MVIRKMTPKDYEDFTIGQVLDILVGINNMESRENGDKAQNYVYDEKSVDRIMMGG